MVCMGNICRSPMAQMVALQMAQSLPAGGDAGWRKLSFDSAGTHANHIGQPADPRAKAALERHGYKVGKARSRRITEKDFTHYDLIVAMDSANLSALQRLCPPEHMAKLCKLLDFADGLSETDVPDPYYGNEAGFERVLDLCEVGVRGLLGRLQQQRQAPHGAA